MTTIVNTIASGESPIAATRRASSSGICVSARKTLSRSAPSMIRKIMPVALAVP